MKVLSSIRLEQESKPDHLEKIDRIIISPIKLESLRNEQDLASLERKRKLGKTVEEEQRESDRLTNI